MGSIGRRHLNVMVAVHLRAGVDRQLVAEHRRGAQPQCLLGREQLSWAAAGGAVDPLPGHLRLSLLLPEFKAPVRPP